MSRSQSELQFETRVFLVGSLTMALLLAFAVLIVVQVSLSPLPMGSQGESPQLKERHSVTV